MQEAQTYSLGKRAFSYNPGMENDPVRQRIRDFVENNGEGHTYKSLSKDLARNETYIQQFVKKGRPAELDEPDVQKLAAIMGCAPEDLRGPRGTAGLRDAFEITQHRRAPRAATGPIGGLVPVYGQAAAGPDGQFPWNGTPVDRIAPPASLANVRDAYAVYVAGDSMEERYYSGEAVFVNPYQPYRVGHFVVVQIATDDGGTPDAYIKQLAGLDSRQIRLRQFNPKKIITFPARKVISIHRIVMGGDG